MVRISELELEWSLIQFELHLELGFFLIFELSTVWFFFQIILCTLDFVCWLTADFDQVPHTWKIFFYTNGLSCVCEARFIGLASGPQRQTTCLPVRGCFLVLVCLCVVVWIAFVLWCGYCLVSSQSFLLHHLVIALVRNTKKESRNYPIRHFRNEKGNRPGMGSGIVTGDLPVIYWPIFLCF